MSLNEQRALEETFLMPVFSRKPVQLTRGQGMVVFDDAGRSYLDFIGGIGVVSLGHCHPALVQAVSEQASQLLHVGNYYYIEKRGELACTLSGLLNEGMREPQTTWKTFFANSGAEANECALKLARLHAKRCGAVGESAGLVVVLDRGFHGRTLATLAATAQPAKQEAFQPLPSGFVATPPNDVAALEAVFERHGSEVCGLLAEPIQGESGVHPLSQEFLEAARELTSACGALLMFDEVQCGMYRCGTHPFAFQHTGVVPDVVTMAKGIAGGVPMGACAARSEACVFEAGDHGSTFGGSNLAIAAATAVLATIEREGLADQVERVGAYLRAELRACAGVAEVRGRGLMVGADLAPGINAFEVVGRALDAGLLLNATGPSTLRFLPPLVCSTQDVDVLIERLEQLL